MTTTAFDDQFTPSTQTIEIVHAPYEPVAILKRNVAELELALKRQTERAEAAEAELARLREQKPVAWCDADGDFYSGESYPNVWPSAVPSVVFMAHNKTSSILFAARKDADQYAASFGPAAGVSVTECAVIGSQSAPAPDVPAVQLVDGSDDYYDYLGALVEQHPAGVMHRNTDDKAPAVPAEWRDTP